MQLLLSSFIATFVFLACRDERECCSSPTPPVYSVPADTIPFSNYTQLKWSDEFDGKQLNASTWEHEVNDKGGGNNELQYYTAEPRNAFVKNGNLVIEAIKENYKTRQYTSARLRTKNKADFTFGRMDIRAKLPKGQGIWPAIWMLPTDEVYGSWPKSGEIDVMETVGHKPATLHGTAHYGPDWPDNKFIGDTLVLPTGDFSDDFHVFSIVWEKDVIRWYLDGVRYHVIRPTDVQPHRYPFNERFHFILNVAVGGNWPGNPNSTTVFPQQMLVDYVRVYEVKR